MISSVSKPTYVLGQIRAAQAAASLGSRADSVAQTTVDPMKRTFAAAPPHGAHNTDLQSSAFDAFKIERDGIGKLPKDDLIRYHETREELLSRQDNFNQWSVHIGDKASLQSKVRAIQSDGPSDLMILADFDQTISSYYVPDSLRVLRDQRLAQLEAVDPKQDSPKQEGPLLAEATIKCMLECDRITQEGIDETRQLFKKYRPIEIDPNLSLAEKQNHMKDWWTENLKLFSSLKLTDNDFRKIVQKSKMACRHGVVELLEQARVNDLPFVVVSGGVKEVIDVIFYEIIREKLMKSHLPYDLKEYQNLQQLYNLRVLSNTFHFEDVFNKETNRIERTAVDYDSRLLHSMNKYEFVNEISKDVMKPLIRKNVVVMGDQLHDLKVVEPSNHENILSIGYLNDMKNEHQLEAFLENFDVVVCRDGPLLPLNMILDTLCVNASDQQAMLQPYKDFPQLKELYELLLPPDSKV